MKKVIFIFSFLLLVGCGIKEINVDDVVLKSSNLKSKSDMAFIQDVFKENDMDNADKITSLISKFNKLPDNGCGIVSNWSNKITYNEAACTDRYEKKYDISDGNCRITAFSLVDKYISLDEKIKDEGSYLMFDMDVIDNNKDYSFIKRDKFVSFYNEIDVSGLNKEEIKNAYAKKWDDLNIKMTNDKASIISVVMHDPDSKVVFVGHTGVLMSYKGKLIFAEKIAFEQPYQVTVFNNTDELVKMLMKRDLFLGDGSEEGPFIYQNNKLIYSYKA